MRTSVWSIFPIVLILLIPAAMCEPVMDTSDASSRAGDARTDMRCRQSSKDGYKWDEKRKCGGKPEVSPHDGGDMGTKDENSKRPFSEDPGEDQKAAKTDHGSEK